MLAWFGAGGPSRGWPRLPGLWAAFRYVTRDGSPSSTSCSEEAQKTVRSYFLEAIADTIKRLDHIEPNVACLELLAQPLDVAIDGPVVHIHLFVIGSIHQGIAAF